MVFIPILVMQLEVGQLFRDIAVAISVSVLLSLLVSITVIPALSSKLLSGDLRETVEGRKLPFLDLFARSFVAAILNFTKRVISSRTRAAGVVLIVVLLSGIVTTLLLPKLDYLPEIFQTKEGDKVFTSGKDGIFSPGIPIGKIFIEDNILKVKLFSDPNQLSYVGIVIDNFKEENF